MPASGPRSRRDWGWHPLRPDWASRVVDSAGVRPGELVLDLGAGHGALSEPLLAAGASVLAVELHPRRAATLRERFADHDLRVVRCDLRELRLPRRPFRVVASPPYQLSTDLVRILLGSTGSCRPISCSSAPPNAAWSNAHREAGTPVATASRPGWRCRGAPSGRRRRWTRPC